MLCCCQPTNSATSRALLDSPDRRFGKEDHFASVTTLSEQKSVVVRRLADKREVRCCELNRLDRLVGAEAHLTLLAAALRRNRAQVGLHMRRTASLLRVLRPLDAVQPARWSQQQQ